MIHQANRDVYAHTYTMTADEKADQDANKGKTYPVNDEDLLRTRLAIQLETCSKEQMEAYSVLNQALMDEQRGVFNQVIMFLSGEGGTGKSHVIACMAANTRIIVGKTRGSWGAVVLAAPTGGSAANINGNTWQHYCSKGSTAAFSMKAKVSENLAKILIAKAEGCRVFVLDEVSLFNLESLAELDHSLQIALQNNKPFGGLNMVIGGDLHQVNPLSNQNYFIMIILNMHAMYAMYASIIRHIHPLM